MAEVSIPSSLDPGPLFIHYSKERVQFPGIKPEALGNGNFRNQPELRLIVASAYMHVDWLSRISLVRKEVEPIALASEDRRHGISNSTAPRRRPAGVALQARAVADHGEVAAFGAGFADVAFHARFPRLAGSTGGGLVA